MAKRRMFNLQIVDSDAFLDLPASTQNLYFHLGMRGDDDGFVGNVTAISRVCSATRNDLDLLIAKGFLIPFVDGVVVIKHWRLNNTLQNDRYKPTQYNEDKAALLIKENGAYTLDETQGRQLVGTINPLVASEKTQESQRLIEEIKKRRS